MIIYAVNVNTGGGKVLLDRLLLQNPFEPTSAAFLDKRYSPPSEYKGKRISFSISSRLFAEKKLHCEVKSHSPSESVLFFGNLPPFCRPKINSYLYLQNCYLTGQIPLPKDTLREWFRNWIESWILKLFYKNVNEIWVQTEWMKTLAQKWCPKATIKVKPFLPLLPKTSPNAKKISKFMYVGSLSTNKQLSTFLSALQDLDKSLTTKITAYVILNNKDQSAKYLTNFVKDLKNISLEIRCTVNRQELFHIYETTEYLVVTSMYESYYLPMYEALHFGCKIIAPDNVGYTAGLPIESVSYFKLPHLNLRNFI